MGKDLSWSLEKATPGFASANSTQMGLMSNSPNWIRASSAARKTASIRSEGLISDNWVDFKQYQPVNGNIVFKKADEDAKMKELVFENGYVVDYEEALNVANQYPMTIKFAISAQTVKMDEATFVQDWPENN